ncbi:peroxidase [Sinorhizobium medicae]|nr:peroxidase [Sinorhizobium medicae]
MPNRYRGRISRSFRPLRPAPLRAAPPRTRAAGRSKSSSWSTTAAQCHSEGAREEGRLAELPRGIYWDKGQMPPRCYAIAILRADQKATAAGIDKALAALAGLWNDLRVGGMPTLQGATTPSSSFEWLLGYGRKAFEIAGSKHPVPRKLRPPNSFNSVDPQGGGLAIDGSGLKFAEGIAQNPATEQFCVQFTGDTPLSIARAIVETSLLLESMREPVTGKAPLMVSASFTGFNREDRRSWLDFHDGLSNLQSGAERRSVIEARPQGLAKSDKWLAGGTYMAFIRLRIDIRLWRTLTKDMQESLVGRTKISGCPVVAIDSGGVVVADPLCPAHGTSEVDAAPDNARFLEPPDAVDEKSRLSHVQRANHHIVRQRVYRQGYEFFENSALGRPLEVGLNFVSFQENPDRLFFMLKTETWLGKTNFGGWAGPEILHVVAGAIFVCPPIVEGETYPGASTFSDAGPLIS